jgi:hypothetical protein
MVFIIKLSEMRESYKHLFFNKIGKILSNVFKHQKIYQLRLLKFNKNFKSRSYFKF